LDRGADFYVGGGFSGGVGGGLVAVGVPGVVGFAAEVEEFEGALGAFAWGDVAG